MIVSHLIAWFDEVTGRAGRRRLQAELARADGEIALLRALLADATRPPTQFARMREREVAIRRLTRLQIARSGRVDRLTRELTGIRTRGNDQRS